MSPVAKRALFTTPSRSAKRVKRTKTVMKIPRSLLPETKNYIGTLTNTATSSAYSSIPLDMTQGDDGSQFLGQKFRMTRLRVNYDFSQLPFSEAVRVTVLIPKDPTTTPSILNAASQWDTSVYTVLHDMILPDAPEALAGTFDVVGPINVDMNSAGTSVLRNNIWIYCFSASAGTAMAPKVLYQLWFTDA